MNGPCWHDPAGEKEGGELQHTPNKTARARPRKSPGAGSSAGFGALAVRIQEDPVHGIRVTNLSRHVVKDGDAVVRWINAGNARRKMAETAANAVSSRSHAVLQLMVEAKDRPDVVLRAGPDVVSKHQQQQQVVGAGAGVAPQQPEPAGSDVQYEVRTGKFSLIDLAGSERAAATANRGARLKEGKYHVISRKVCMPFAGSAFCILRLTFSTSDLSRLLFAARLMIHFP
jgi:hypothetical protein